MKPLPATAFSPDELSLAPERWPADGGTVPSLDGLRALSILLVLFGHFFLPRSISGIGALGVTVFFFISGFLITRLLFSEMKAKGTISVKNFYLRRLLRLYPVIVVSMLLCVGFAIATQRPVDGMEVSSVFLYFTNYLVAYREFHPAPYTLPISAFWSLSVEEHFYLIFPAVFVFLKGNPLRVAQIAVATCVSCLALRCFYLIAWPEMQSTLTTYWRSETRFDAIAFGVLMAALPETPGGRKALSLTIRPPVVMAALVAIVASFAFRNSFYQNTFRFSIQDMALFPVIGSFIFAARFTHANRFLNSALMVWIGKLSYSLYVWHGAVIYLLSGIALTYLSPFAHQPFLFACSFVAAILSYFLLEMPFVRIRQRLRR